MIGGDHAGFELKGSVADWLRELGHEVIDVGAFSEEPSDYPDFAAQVGREVVSGRADRGIVVCGSGAGASIAANKIKGVRCAMTNDHYTAHQCVEHDDANVITFGSRIIGEELAREVVCAFVAAKFSGEQRHVRRLEKVRNLEDDFCK